MELSKLKIPTHVSVIMDGNGRWAKKKGKPRTFGHKRGAEVVMDICRDADDLGIKYMTIYAFSTENWSRPDLEVKTLMLLFGKYLKICYDEAMKNNMRVRIIGDTSVLAPDLQEKIRVLEEDTRTFTGFNLQIAINYGSRDEMLRAMKRMMKDYKDGRISEDDVNEARFGSYLDTADIPDPDLMIRTSGELRLSNYLMWQHAYSEFYFTDTPWPDFNKAELVKAIEAYTARDRRYGKVKEA
ncbi:MAG: isoprenyl transferase [Clostridiales bacterium]|nr:isoprenyl transferase [Clostridiales bacterium]MCD8133947.1 isoprenyl transferase [Clostridiales bacterium]